MNIKISIQRLRNLTTSRLHTNMGDIYEDIGSIMGGVNSTIRMLRAIGACRPWLREHVTDPRFWNGEYDTTHTGDIELPTPTDDERKAMLQRYAEQNINKSMNQAHSVADTVQVKAPETTQTINHPRHYTSHPSGVEAITIARHMSFNLGNVVKYIFRAGLKPNTSAIEDLKKAAFYIQDEITRLTDQKQA